MSWIFAVSYAEGCYGGRGGAFSVSELRLRAFLWTAIPCLSATLKGLLMAFLWTAIPCLSATLKGVIDGISVNRNSMSVGYVEGPFDGIAVATQTIFMHSSLLRTFWAGQTLNECDISQSRQSPVVYYWEAKR